MSDSWGWPSGLPSPYQGALSGPLDVLGGIDSGAAFKVPCKVATTADMTSTMKGLPVIDGYQTVSGDRILVVANTSQATNGIYNAQTGAWSRAIDFTNSSSIYKGTQVLVVGGLTSAWKVLVCQTDNPVIGATPIVFARLTSLGGP